jgi:hypothetical protein
MKKITFILIAFTLLIGTSIEVAAQSGKTVVFATDLKSLERTKAKINNKDPQILNAYKQLIKDADNKALKFGPVSVMEKINNPPSGDKHDYMSLAPYHWPDSSKPDGLPYIRKDGQTNPEVKDYKDKDYLPKLCDYVYTLGLAYYFSEENVYAEHAAKLLKVWFLDPETKMNPNLNYGQAIKGVNQGRGAGLIDTRHLIKLIDGIGMIKTSKYWKEADQQGMKKWFSDFLNWMQTSKNGTDEMKTKNNHGAWYDAQRLSFALFADSTDLAKRIVANAADRLDKQMDDNGLFPAEMERTISLHYTSFVMNAFFTIAKMSEKTGFDFWNHVTASGKSLKKSFDVMKPYFLQEKEWHGEQIKDFDNEDAYPLLMDASVYLKCKNCVQAVKQLADEKAPRLRINLLY